MDPVTVPTSRDIYLEADGRRVAVVERYEAKAERTLYEIEELGRESPAATVRGRPRYTITLRRVLLLSGSGEIDFYDLHSFDLVIVKPDCRIIYSGCEWSQISEALNLGQPCLETAVLTAQRRTLL